jgi:hypothetical protein
MGLEVKSPLSTLLSETKDSQRASAREKHPSTTGLTSLAVAHAARAAGLMQDGTAPTRRAAGFYQELAVGGGYTTVSMNPPATHHTEL